MYVCMYVCLYVSSYIQAIETFKCAFERVLPTGDQRTRSFSNCLACEWECGCWMTTRQPAWHYQLVQRPQHEHIVTTIWYNMRNADTFSQQFFEIFLLLHLLPSLSSVYYCIIAYPLHQDLMIPPNQIPFLCLKMCFLRRSQNGTH